MKLIELTKVCTGCEKRKEWKKFSSQELGRFGIASKCKVCRAIYDKSNYNANIDKYKIHGIIYYATHKKERSAYNKDYHKKNAAKINARHRVCYSENIDEKRDRGREYYYRNKNSKTRMRDRIYAEGYKNRRNALLRKRRNAEPKFKLNENISRAIRSSLEKGKNGRHWEKLVGYTLNKLKRHLEKQFTKNMSWENYGQKGWTIDHKIPISAFNFMNTEQRDFKRCWALSNLQPMWAPDNISKHNKLTKHFQPSLLI